ncbi:hypothetical protein HO173_009019 [Letharia columbiana]|uniref:Uncharacterized protein n=1 Tax=Letharia columbiana TaxID=112416 RepID=A0A8H6L290_9LECA|nr:uncharacterized protein HO173_009019 [Letharia columbiana]KAF6232805.1 hypothetical protein HO173_009019 [Letharia columbiana]
MEITHLGSGEHLAAVPLGNIPQYSRVNLIILRRHIRLHPNPPPPFPPSRFLKQPLHKDKPKTDKLRGQSPRRIRGHRDAETNREQSRVCGWAEDDDSILFDPHAGWIRVRSGG